MLPTLPSSGLCLASHYNCILKAFRDAVLTPAERQHRMSFSPHQSGRRERWLLLAIVVVLQGNQVSADSVSPPAFDAEAHAQVCKCGSLCQHASCCCGRSARAAREDRASTSSPHADSASFAPCLEEAPCGDSGLPPTAGFRLQEMPAVAAESLARSTPLISDFLVVHTSCGRPQWRPSRIQRPPRRHLLA
jgi:hypothetical protein